MELLKYVYLCAQKSIIKAVNNKFQDLINAPRISLKCRLGSVGHQKGEMHLQYHPGYLTLWLLNIGCIGREDSIKMTSVFKITAVHVCTQKSFASPYFNHILK